MPRLSNNNETNLSLSLLLLISQRDQKNKRLETQILQMEVVIPVIK